MTEFTKSYATRKRLLVAFMLLQMASWPVIAMFLSDPEADPAGFVSILSLVLALTVYFWCRYDAASIGKTIPWLTAAAIIVIPGFGYPLYMIRVKRKPMGEAISMTVLWTLLFVGIIYAVAFSLNYLWVSLH